MPIDSLLFDEPPVVPIESLGYDGHRSGEPGAEQATPVGGLEAELPHLRSPAARAGAEAPSLEALVGRALAERRPPLQ